MRSSLRHISRRVGPMLVALVVGGFALSFAPRGAVSPLWFFAFACTAIAWVSRSPMHVERDDTLPAFAVLASSLGLMVVARLSTELAHRQEMWLLAALVAVMLVAPTLDRFRRFAAYRYVWLLASIALFGAVALFGEEINGARLWIQIGSFAAEPVEFIKLFVVLFLAGYLAETADVIAVTKAWSIRANLKYLGPLFLGWATSMAILVFERDIGMASLSLATFVAMLYVATKRIDLIVGGAILFASAVACAVVRYPYIIARFGAWRNPFADPYGTGYQPLQGLFSLAAGGLFGTGYRSGSPNLIPESATDYVFAAWSEEFGALGAIVLLGAFLVVVVRALQIARSQPDLYAKLLATGLATSFGVGVFVIVGGVLGLFPLTGITLPFVSYGGSSLLANFVSIAAIWAISGEATHAMPSEIPVRKAMR